MPSRGLLDDVLVAVARSVRRWADRLLDEHAHETSGHPAMAEMAEAPSAPEADADPRDDRDDDDAFDHDGPPAHWLETVRERAPHLLPPGYRRGRSPERTPTSDAWPHDAPEPEPAPEPWSEAPDPAMSGEAAATARSVRRVRARSEGRDREPARPDRAAAGDHRTEARVPAAPAPLHEGAARSATPIGPASTPGATPGTPAAPGASLRRTIRRSMGRDAGEASREAARAGEPGAEMARNDGAAASSRRIARDDVAPGDAADQRARRQGDAAGPARAATQRWYRAPEAARREAAEPAAREPRSSGSPRRDAARRSLRFHRPPDPADAEGTASVRRGDDVPARREPGSPRELAPARDLAPRATAQELATHAAPPPRTPRRRDAAPADHEAVAVSPFAVPGEAAATSALVRPRTPTQPMHASYEPPRAPAAPAWDRRATPVMPEPPGWDPVAVQRGVSIERSVHGPVERSRARAGHGHPRGHALPMEMCAAMWPRLPDESDEAGGDRYASPWTSPDEGLWPQLPVDELVPVEEPPHNEPGRDDHLRREQRGIRWSERRS